MGYPQRANGKDVMFHIRKLNESLRNVKGRPIEAIEYYMEAYCLQWQISEGELTPKAKKYLREFAAEMARADDERIREIKKCINSGNVILKEINPEIPTLVPLKERDVVRIRRKNEEHSEQISLFDVRTRKSKVRKVIKEHGERKEGEQMEMF